MASSPDKDPRAGTAPDVALRLIVAGCRADLVKYRAVVATSRRPIGIHQTRVALRRLRAAFSVFRDAVDGPQVRSLSAEARWLAGECAPARDLHVFLTETVSDVPPLVRRIGNRLAAAHLERARAALAGARFAAFDRQLSAFAAKPPAAAPSATSAAPALRLDDFGQGVLEARHRKVIRRAHRLEQLDSERLHRLRIAIKKLRYAATYLRPAFASAAFASKGAKAYIEATVRLQGALGALNDRATAAQVVADLALAARPSEDVTQPLKALAKQAASGSKRRRRRLERAWKDFRKVERFWRA
ncbi:MAG: CHAD domain-containing protein [Reyranella sp.]|uniref:CHAD domain-containing protein n=1 Tax=Bradyrhizobium sp. TaxID=376 RepID=UPI00273102E6|nr:CHAD domain-containing protein [Bradyrhizobium sp.]MDP1868925.1 CHAD domain-containing protein [Bradyrhizobium sp.]MDP3162333.1 CHAD domain-containing protein [Reyranella sp.]